MAPPHEVEKDVVDRRVTYSQKKVLICRHADVGGSGENGVDVNSY